MLKRQSGFHIVPLLVAVVMVAVVGTAAWMVMKPDKKPSVAQSSLCTQPMLKSPADLSKATSVLYPGQTRGGDYKAHGGLRFDGSKNDEISVKAPIDARLISGSRYIERGEVQYMLDFETDCDVNFRLDHLLVLPAKIQKAVDDNLPAAKPDDSRTTDIKPAVEVSVGEVVATAVGFRGMDNVSFDFGVYDLSRPNGAGNETNDMTKHGVCWLKGWLPDVDSARLAALPAGDAKSGATSDYCK